MGFHEDPVERADLIRDYLRRELDLDGMEAFERHYLACDECFEELRITGLLMAELNRTRITLRKVDDVLVLKFAGPAELTRQSLELDELQRAFKQVDTKVIIDLGSVARIDSAGLGQLLSHHSHVIKNHGTLKLLNPNAQVRTLLKLTRIDSVLETYKEEQEALASFRRS